MKRVVYSSLGRPSRRTRVGPGRGMDNAVVSLGGGRVLIVTVDPVSAIPPLGMELSAWLSVQLIASDITAAGVDPEFATFSFNFPPELAGPEREEYVRAVGDGCRELGVAVIAGNTGTYPGGGFTVIGAGTMFAVAPEDRFVTPAMARAGDRVFVTKGGGMEAAASLAWSFPELLSRRGGEGVAESARKMVRECTTVADARAARKAGLGEGGVTSMHDATEGGILGALDEMAEASKKRFVVDPRQIPVSDAAAAVCGAFGVDPLRTMGEGALLITCSPGGVGGLGRAMSRAGIPLTEVGEVKVGGGLFLSGKGGLRRFRQAPDGYWSAYEGALGAGSSRRNHLI